MSLEMVEQELAAMGVIEGILWDEIRQNVYLCNSERRIISELVIARGRPPRHQRPECLYFSPVLQKQSRLFRQIDSKGEYHPPGESAPGSGDKGDQVQGRELEEVGGRVDFRESNSIEVIHEGQLLARRLPLRPGQEGVTVTGEILPYGELEIKQLEPGLNTRIDEDGRVFSTVAGRLVWDKESFGVDTNIEISGDVGYATGNIRFPGNIILKGEIQDGFRLWVGGDIVSSSTIDAFEIFCKGSIRCSEGIIGRGKGLVRAKGELEAKFIENCHVDVFGDISIKSALLNSMVSGNGNIHLEKGKIVGGTTRFRKNLRVGILGNPAGVQTIVHGGIDFVVHRRLEYLRQKIEEVSLREQQLRQQSGDRQGSGDQELLFTLTREMEALQHELSGLLETAVPDSESSIEVLDRVYAGTLIRFGSVEKRIQEDMGKTSFCLDESGNAIISPSAGK